METKDCKSIQDFIELKEEVNDFQVNFENLDKPHFISILNKMLSKYFSLNSYQEFIEFRKKEVSLLNKTKHKKSIFNILFNKKEECLLKFEKDTYEYNAFNFLFSFFPDIVKNQESILDLIKYAKEEADSVYIERAKEKFEHKSGAFSHALAVS